MTTSPLFSVVINNYNYAHYLRECVDSALNQDWPNVEVIVVDDGSSDNSREVIESYGSRIKAVFKENGGQGSAVNAGFEASGGEWIIFLDADDMLKPDAVESVMQSARVATSNVQYYLEVIDDESHDTGVRLPTRPMHEGDVRSVVVQFRYYNSPPSSGNAYSRKFLEQVLPMPPEKWRISADAYLILAAPFYGFIDCVKRPLASYRRHGGGASDSGNGDLASLRTYVNKELHKEIKRELYVRRLINTHRYLAQMRTYMSPTYCKYLLMDSELNRDSMSIHERIEIVGNVLTCAARWPNYTFKHRIVFIVWCLTAMALPLRLLVLFAGRTMLPHWRAKTKLNGLWQQPMSGPANR
jgi:glycosyltransferase involved in cell wall biosynthesis